MSILPNAPTSLSELKVRLDLLVGLSLEQIANTYKIALPTSFKRAKGFTGELIEKALGANALNLPLPDFTHLAIELKTIPVSDKLEPLESTYICHLKLMPKRGESFFESTLYKKTALILFVAIEGLREIEGPKRKVLGYYLYKPDAKTLEIIKNDYEEVMEQISLGRAHEITARTGTIVQVRPKGASGKDLVPYVNEDGEIALTRPRGFYFRAAFTKEICKKMFKLNA